jgi:hypothetical protein
MAPAFPLSSNEAKLILPGADRLVYLGEELMEHGARL